MVIGLLLAVAAEAAAPGTLPHFEFRGVVAGTPADENIVSRCRASDSVPGERSCITLADTVAGAAAATVVTYYNGRLSSVYLSSSQGNYTAIASAFKEKYGTPCDVREEEWKSRGGVKTENTVVTWCFKSGRLMLNEIGGKLGQMSALYSDENKPPKAKPTVDF